MVKQSKMDRVLAAVDAMGAAEAKYLAGEIKYNEYAAAVDLVAAAKRETGIALKIERL